MGTVYRRATDWLDWMLVEAWNCEHNQLHHYYLSEEDDPDLVEENLRLMRETRAPRAVKVVVACGMMLIWKWYYPNPNPRPNPNPNPNPNANPNPNPNP